MSAPSPSATAAAAAWSADAQASLDAALRASQGRSFDTAKERWASIASMVPDRSPRECAERFQAVRRALRNQQQQHEPAEMTQTNPDETTNGITSTLSSTATIRAKQLQEMEQQKIEEQQSANPQSNVTSAAQAQDSRASNGIEKTAVGNITMDFWGMSATTPAPLAQSHTPAVPETQQVFVSPPPKPKAGISVHKRDSKTNGWWRKSIAIDLLTQQPIAKLTYAPFRFVATAVRGGMGAGSNSQQDIMFDGQVLALYMVSTGRLKNPVTKVDITETQAKSLDSYLLQHFLRPAHLKAALAFSQSVANLCGSGKRSSDLSSASDFEERICELRDDATAALQEVLKDSIGLTPLLERALVGDMVGFGWEPMLEQLRDVQARQSALQAEHHAQLLRRRMEEASPANNGSIGGGTGNGYVGGGNGNIAADDMHAALMIRERMKEHAYRQSLGLRSSANGGDVKAGNNVKGPIESIKANKAARKHSKTGAVNYLLATAPHMSSRVQMATTGTVSWGGSDGSGMLGLPKPAAPISKKNANKKKKKKEKKSLQGLAMKMN